MLGFRSHRVYLSLSPSSAFEARLVGESSWGILDQPSAARRVPSPTLLYRKWYRIYITNVRNIQSTVRKKMVAVHFTTIPCEPNRAINTHRKPHFGEIHPCTNKIVYTRFEVFRPFLRFFMSGFRIFVR